jgi:Fe-S cluster biosynthesis and repair protein YggX
MAELSARLDQFRKMANDDPNNELAHFSLGRALADAGQLPEAVEEFRTTIRLNANLSKAYQLLAGVLEQLKDTPSAVGVLTEGVKIADSRGDLMPRNAMAARLKELGAAVPAFKNDAAAQPVGEGQVLCSRCGEVKPKLPKPPFSHAQGHEIYNKVCADCWRAWIPMGTKVINELRLPLADPQAQKMYDQHMLEFLNLR